MGKVLLITNTSSTLFWSMKEQLENLNHEMHILSANVDEICNVSDNTDVVLIYLDEQILSDNKLLIYIRDMVLECDMKLFLIGHKDYFERVRKTLPSHVIQDEFRRPLDVNHIVKEITEYIVMREKNNRKIILVVDDSGTMLRSIKGWLDDKYQVILANSATMAIKYLAKDIPDLILLDYEMPVCDGKQVFEMIRSEKEFEQIPIFFLTGKNDRESVQKLLALNPEGYLLKSMKPDEIVMAIENYFA